MYLFCYINHFAYLMRIKKLVNQSILEHVQSNIKIEFRVAYELWLPLLLSLGFMLLNFTSFIWGTAIFLLFLFFLKKNHLKNWLKEEQNLLQFAASQEMTFSERKRKRRKKEGKDLYSWCLNCSTVGGG